MILDGDKFSNVDISNGKVISDGGNYIVMGVAVPGLKDSLDISEDKWEELDDEELEKKLGNSFEISADTTDFELGMTITMATKRGANGLRKWLVFDTDRKEFATDCRRFCPGGRS